MAGGIGPSKCFVTVLIISSFKYRWKKVKGADSKREKPSPTIASVDKDSKRDARDNATEKQICLKHLGYTMGVDDCECKLSS